MCPNMFEIGVSTLIHSVACWQTFTTIILIRHTELLTRSVQVNFFQIMAQLAEVLNGISSHSSTS